MQTSTSARTFQGPRVIGHLSPEILRSRPLTQDQRKRAEEELLVNWTLRVKVKRPFIQTQYETLVRRLKTSFQKENGTKPTRSQKKNLRFQAGVEIAKKYKNARF
ncbi:hypothetical protein KKC45_01845 [Patescibacteria group bacterium]|nr:hypothetical protein [Patescibacteria group bacterium]